LDATITADAAGSATLRLASGLGAVDYAMTPLGPGVWEAKATADLPLLVRLEFDADGFRLSTGRTRRLRFTRAA